MTTEVIHTKPNHEGGTRITLAEPHGSNLGHRRVVAKVPGRTHDGDGSHTEIYKGQFITVEHHKGDPAEETELFLSGQREFIVPPGTTELEFDDGTTVPVTAGGPPAE
jgi:hypothetical protein